MEGIRIARDWAIIILALEGIIFATIALLAAFYAQKGMGQALPRIQESLVKAKNWMATTRETVRIFLRRIASPFAAVHAAFYAIRTFFSTLTGHHNEEKETICKIEQA